MTLDLLRHVLEPLPKEFERASEQIPEEYGHQV